MVKKTIQVVLRARPTAKPAESQCIVPGNKTLSVKDPKQREQEYQFTFDNVLQNASQDEVYQACADDLVDTVLSGCNATILAYGQTGAGKTYTMTGGKADYKQRGLIPRSIHKVFAGLKKHLQSTCTIRVNYLEIYNEQCYDLLDISTQPSDIAVIEDSKDRVIIKGIAAPLVSTEAEALQYLFEGTANRMVAEHQLNRESSRSHTIFSIMLERSTGAEGDEVIVSKLNLVDLAGSERISKTKSEGTVLKEAQQINKSLSFLEQVIVALSVRGRDHIPYRSSKLTHMLKDSLGGNCKTLMVACIWGEVAQLEETTSTCRFAQRMRCVANDFIVNVRKEPTAVIRKYEQDIAELQQELAMHDSLTERHQITYGQYTDAQKAEVSVQVQAFLQSEDVPDSIAPLQLVSLRHMKEVLIAAKALYRQVSAQSAGTPAAEQMSEKEGVSAQSPPVTSTSHADVIEGEAVGDLEHGTEHSGIPMAPADARPPSITRVLAPSTSQSEPGVPGSNGFSPAISSFQQAPPDQQAAFEQYKQGAGALKAGLLADNKAKLRQAKQHARELSLAINGTKHQIDALKASEEAALMDQAADSEAAPSSPSQQSKELKGLYREQYSELHMVKAEADYTQKLVEQCMQELVQDFQDWYAATYAQLPPEPEDVLQSSTSDPALHASTSMPEQELLTSKGRPQINVLPPDLADEEAVAYYDAQHGLQGKMSTLKRGMQGTRRRPAIAKF
ncbi:hypothetical protein WJX77_005047 [Trebouxia sp. C0004]